MRTVSPQEACGKRYDALIVGSGFAGSILALQLSQAGRSVLVVEAGEGKPVDFQAHLNHVDTYKTAAAKIPNSPFPTSQNAPQPLVTDVTKLQPGVPSTKGYFVQEGPQPFESTYTRRLGGTSLHWFGSCPRMLPEDFAMATNFGRGVDWPLSYDDLLPYYSMAEAEFGVSADVEDQTFHGIHFPPGYVYPMHKIPQSYLDLWMTKGLADMRVDESGQPIMIRSIPQARNSIPNLAYDNGRGYIPRGAVGDPGIGTRCMGNSSCLPICPIQARYNALKTFTRADGDLLNKAVASRLMIDADSSRVTGVVCKVWQSDAEPNYEEITLSGDTVILAANAIENAVLLLASEACRTSDQVGRNLMDHPAILSWGLAPQSIGAFRGPGLTSTLVNFRGGSFRRERAAFVFEIGNWGWNWPKDDPVYTVKNLVDHQNLYGIKLRREAGHTISRQIRVDLMTEQLPSAENRVTLSRDWKDRLGNFRPVIHYHMDDYSKVGMAFGREFSRRVFRHLGILDHTLYSESVPGAFSWNKKLYAWAGVGHVAGTHRMGANKHDSVVNTRQRAWDHENLYVVGCGSLPTLGTSNPTTTMAALTFMTAQDILKREG